MIDFNDISTHLEVRELHSLYVNIYIFSVAMSYFLMHSYVSSIPI